MVNFPKTLSNRQATELAQIFSALSDASRLLIISILAEGERNVSDIAEAVKLSESATSHQLRTLRQMRLVRTRKVGRQVFYILDDEHVKSLYLLGLGHILHSH
jgi:DNA-binding transcriptional ArsR family regulator